MMKKAMFLGGLILLLGMISISFAHSGVFAIYPSDDSYVDSRRPDMSFGSSTALYAGTETWGSSERIIYLKFDISVIPPGAMIVDAHLDLKIGAGPFCGNTETISVYRVDDQTWDENTITYTNQPTDWNLTPDDSLDVTGSPPYIWSWSVTGSLKFVHNMGGNIISLALPGEGPGQCDKNFHSKESIDIGPTIMVHVEEANNPPVADAGSDQTIEANITGGANVQLDGSGSYDPDGDPLTYQWTWDTESATGVSPMVFLPLGMTTITLVVNDGMLDSEPDTVDIIVQDTTPPEIVLFEPDPSKLWPPNHKFIYVVIMGIALDICDIDLDINVSVEVIDAEGGDGGAEHEPDYEIVDAVVDEDGIIEILLSLRAERAGIGDGRIYRITAEVTDDSGNSSDDTIEAFVPHDRGNRKK